MLEIRDLSVRIGRHQVVAIDELTLASGDRMGLVGESGSGKTMTAMSIAGLQPRTATVSGSIRLNGRELLGLDPAAMAEVRGTDLGVIFQDPLRALNPTMRVGKQVGEAIRLHQRVSRRTAREQTVELLTRVGLDDAGRLVGRYPHQLSGGQRQRVLIATAIACEPILLIADEPTTALDVTVQQGILDLLVELSTEQGMGLLFVSHDLGVVRTVTSSISVMYGGHIAETGPVESVIQQPRHRYTEALIAASPGRGERAGPAQHGRRFRVIEGTVPPLGSFPSGCPFRGRCGHEVPDCAMAPPKTGPGPHVFRCWNPTAPAGDEVDARTH
ncbi:ABC transporter ATP-binding protein [Jiangella asiatica]|uniref:ABC transporter ATP-binding protein n=1 Tax=Jiangella asiatica TaxID=2530372 RepID=A0A4R5DQ32_9ACTN|nr:ABC transporter ATP-binding protein [Jiangella asiatica]TDE14290.1 ABC transporter ATP-binding protein [Jiangella asiatica]